MVEVNEKLTRQVAHLARLELSDTEVHDFTQQLSKIIGYVEQLQNINVDGVEPLVHPFEMDTPLREDVVRTSPTDSEGKPKVLKSAPEVLFDGYKVPQIL